MLLSIERWIANPKQLFFVDGLGAGLTAFSLSVLLANFEASFGMPVPVLTVLALIATFYAFYSFGCYFFLRHNWHPYLRAIAVANLLYGVATASLVVRHYEQLTLLGLGYFAIELLVLAILVGLEFWVGTKRKI